MALNKQAGLSHGKIVRVFRDLFGIVISRGGVTCRPRQNPENDRLARHLSHHLWNWGVFLVDPEVDATNSRAEHALRGPIVNRKVWGGNRTPVGAEAQSVLCSVLETCRRQFLPALDFLNQTLRGLSPTLLLKL